MKKRILNLESIGNVKADEMKLCESTIGLYIPLEATRSTRIKEEREKLERIVCRDAEKYNPDVDFAKYTLFTETVLHINTYNHILEYAISFTMWFEDDDGNELYCDFSDPFEIELTENDKNTIKKIVLEKVLDMFA